MNLEILAIQILIIYSKSNAYVAKLSEIDLFLSAIQTAITQISVTDENELKLDQ